MKNVEKKTAKKSSGLVIAGIVIIAVSVLLGILALCAVVAFKTKSLAIEDKIKDLFSPITDAIGTEAFAFLDGKPFASGAQNALIFGGMILLLILVAVGVILLVCGCKKKCEKKPVAVAAVSGNILVKIATGIEEEAKAIAENTKKVLNGLKKHREKHPGYFRGCVHTLLVILTFGLIKKATKRHYSKKG